MGAAMTRDQAKQEAADICAVAFVLFCIGCTVFGLLLAVVA